jgi:hypothetical protein
MSRRCVGYTGEGRARQPVYVDEGPSAANSSDGIASLGRLSALTEDQLTTDAALERAAAAEAHGRRSPAEWGRQPATRNATRPALGSPDHLQQSRLDGARRHVEVVAARRPPPPDEEPVMATEPAAPTTSDLDPDGPLMALATASHEAADARAQYEAAEYRWTEARLALLAAWRAVGIDAEQVRAPDALVPLGEIAPEEVDGDRILAEARRLSPVDRLEQTGLVNGGGPRSMRPSDRRILDALLEHGGDRKAASEAIGMKLTSLVGSLSGLRSRHGQDLTAAERAVLSTPRRRAEA